MEKKPIDDETIKGAPSGAEGIEDEKEMEFVLSLVDFPDYSAIYLECN